MKTRTIYIRGLLVFVLSLSQLASCSKEDRGPESGSAVFTVAPQISAGYENIPSTYSSDRGGATNVSAADYRQRYILEVWSEDGTAKQFREVKVSEIGSAAPLFSLRLLPAKYRMAVWADFVTAASVTTEVPGGADLFYRTDDLTGITVLNADFNSDAKDAYAAAFDADLSGSGLGIAVTLRRPLAKVRLVALDADRINSSAGADGCTSNITGVGSYNRYDVLDGKASAAGGHSTVPDYFPVYADYGSAYGAAGADNHSQTLAWDYVFVPSEGLAADITIRMFKSLVTDRENLKEDDIVLFPSADDEKAASKTIRKVMLKPNTLTTVVGNFFTPAETVTPGGGN